MSLQDDGEVSKLEDECNWFRMETNRLQTHSTTMQTDIKVPLKCLDIFLLQLVSPAVLSCVGSYLLSLFVCVPSFQSLRTRLSALRDQNEFLSSQLKAVMKRSRVLEVNLLVTYIHIHMYQQVTHIMLPSPPPLPRSLHCDRWKSTWLSKRWSWHRVNRCVNLGGTR